MYVLRAAEHYYETLHVAKLNAAEEYAEALRAAQESQGVACWIMLLMECMICTDAQHSQQYSTKKMWSQLFKGLKH